MSDYTPDMDAVREDWMQAASNSEGYALVNMDPPDEAELRAQFDRFIADVKADAWDEGLQAGWEECQNPGPFVNDWWDSKAPNPHRIESGAGNE